MPDFERAPLHEMTREPAATARGDLPATLVVRGGRLVSGTSGEILPNMSVAVFLDGHCHIEGSQITVTQYARAVLTLGTTGGSFDAHEVTNVLGLRGLRLMVEEARTTPLAAYTEVASCVPSTSTGTSPT